MTDCPIASAAHFVEQTWKAIDSLAEEFETGLNRDSLTCNYRRAIEHPDDFSGIRAAYEYALHGAYSRQRKDHPAQLLLYFDLWREASADEVASIDGALVCIAYSPKLADGWTLRQILLDQSGSFTDAGSETDIVSAPDLSQKLLYWDEDSEELDWGQESWLFYAKLSDISNPQELDDNLVTPILALLSRDASIDLEAAFEGAEAIVPIERKSK